MKKVISLSLLFLASLQLFAQTDGISYQAIIIGPNRQEIPGMNAQGNILPNARVAIRFTILDVSNGVEYQEIQTTNTDQFGRINLMIGKVDPDGFALISWDGTTKNLKVEIDFSGGGSSYVDMSRQELNFVPYSYHRNILARGTLTVDDATDLNGELTVAGPTNLNSTLNVNNNNATNLSGQLNVNGITSLSSSLSVNGITNLNNAFNVNNGAASNFSGNLTVGSSGTATFNGPTAFGGESAFSKITTGSIKVDGLSKLNGQVTIKATLSDSKSAYSNYPLLVEGSKQGIAIKVSGGRSSDNNYISFWDSESGAMWGSIQGQTLENLWTDPEYLFETGSKAIDLALATSETVIAVFEVIQGGVSLVAASTASTACVGLGACVTVPPPSWIVGEAANLVVKIANGVIAGVNLGLTVADGIAFVGLKNAQIGVTYSSGSGDYAEWLPKANPSEKFSAGDIVGVTNGFITKTTSGANKVMVISTNPIVLGNMPQATNEKNFEKVAFMGQVPVKVLGLVEPGDYILPSEIGSGFGKAVHPDKMRITDYKKIVGVAWSAAEGENIKFANCAVGLNTNDINDVVITQEEKIKSLETEINNLQKQFSYTNDIMCRLVPGFNEALSVSSVKPLENSSKNEVSVVKTEYENKSLVAPNEKDIIYFDVPRELIIEGIEKARNGYLQTGKSFDEHPFWKKMNSEPAYVEEIMQLIETKFDEAINTDKSVNKKFSQTKSSVKK